MSTCISTAMMINSSTSFVEQKLTSPWRNVSNVDAPHTTGYANFDVTPTHTRLHYHPQLNNWLRSTLPLRLSSGSQHCDGEMAPISIPTDTPSHWSTHTQLLDHLPPDNCLWAPAFKRKQRSTLPGHVSNGINIPGEKCLQFRQRQRNPWLGPRGCVSESNDAPAVLCVTFGGAVDWKSWQLKLSAQSTTELRNRHMLDASNGMSGRMVIWEELRAWHGLASVICLLSSVCFLCVFQWLSVGWTW